MDHYNKLWPSRRGRQGSNEGALVGLICLDHIQIMVLKFERPFIGGGEMTRSFIAILKVTFNN